jgi:hypothetical protein
MRISKKVGLAITSAAIVTTTAVAVPISTAGASPHGSTHVVALSKAGTLTSHVFGTFGKAGTVRGTYVPVRSFERAGTNYAQGVLKATLRRSDGTLVGRVVRPDVTLPIQHSATTAAAQATCPILHLTLGPLDLNLLGLHVHLNRVVLDITAISGPGDLLGNLLCAVANLLNGTGLSLTQLLQISNLLNRIIGILT